MILGQNPEDKPPPPRQNPPGQAPPPPDTIPQQSQNLLQNTPNTNHHGKTTQIPNNAPRGQKSGEIQDGVHFKFRWLQSSIINMMSGKLYVYIQLQMRYLIANGRT